MKRSLRFLLLLSIAIVAVSVYDSRANGSRNLDRFFSAIEDLIDVAVHGRNQPVAHNTPPPLESSPSTCTIASWNVRIFSSNSRDDDELRLICDVLANFDLIALQEVRDGKVLRRCVSELQTRGLEYDFVLSKEVGTRSHKERYAFLYKENRVQFEGNAKIWPDLERQFIREPFHADFRIGSFDFTLITVHLLYGGSKKSPERAVELDAIADVYRFVQDYDEIENDVLLTGDFNENPASERFARLRTIDSLRFLVQGSENKTTIFDSSLYDNIIFQV
ncbi:MAG: endonuclease/exonuclease/phosphatase family protein [Planctomycetota bacterium]|nr:endonuclease/exonuclease/phosphatase family protein [Planctomycetota bacterium]